MNMVVGLLDHRQEDHLALVALFIGRPVSVVRVNTCQVEICHQLDLVGKLLLL